MNERTKPRYPTDGPGDGRTWHEYFNQLERTSKAASVDSDADDGDDDLAGTIEVVSRREVGEGEPIPRGIATWRNRLLANEWRYRIGHAVANHQDAYHKNGNLKKAAHTTDTWWINAVKNGEYITIAYVIVDGVVKSSSRSLRSEWWRLIGDKEMQGLVEE